MRGKTTLLLAAVMLFFLSNSANAYREVVDLGTISGYDYSYALSINDNGQIVGGVSNNEGLIPQRAILFDSTGQGNNTNLGGSASIASSINNNGQIVGTSNDRPCIFDASGGSDNIFIGGSSGAAHYINDNGFIVGRFIIGISNPIRIRAFLFDSTNGNTTILSSSDSQSFSINNNNQIVGYNSNEAALFTNGGVPVSLSDSYSSAYGINESGQIVGFDTDPATDTQHAFLFDPTGIGENIDLGTIDDKYSNAFSINELGQIVGKVFTYPNIDSRAVLFDPTGQGNNIDLNTLINPTSGWVLKEARSINNDGWIVGYGTHNGQERAFLLTPEPGTIVLFSLGIAMLRRKRRG